MVGTTRVPVQGPNAVLEVQFVSRPPPRRWRRRVAAWLVRLAGRIAAMRVRVTQVEPGRPS